MLLHQPLKQLPLVCTLLCLLLGSNRLQATHIYGMDLYYSHVSGSTYRVNLAVYGDCSGSAFYTLASSSPVIDVYNGGTYYSSVTLSLQAPTGGTEVTPVCPAQARNTTCTNPSNPLPGIKRYVYSGTVSLSSRSAVWRFLFNGSMGGSSIAGRSSAITNIYLGSSGAPIALTDTLNNAGADNNSAVYTSIPTPFYCINNTSNFNPGAVDTDGDRLDFNLVPAIDASTGSSVSYVYPFTPTAPLAVSSGSFSFSSTTGQITFYPNVVQRSLVVYNVREFNGSTLVGTSQREMTVVVLSPCTNTPPTAAMSSPTAGSLISGTQLDICNSVDTFQFSLNPYDADGDTMNVSVSGLPPGATFSVTGNNTTSPRCLFSWNAAGVAPGTYTLYITLRDSGCPIYSSQTIAYTIHILPAPGVAVTVLSRPTCLRPGVFQVTPLGTGPWAVDVLSGGTSVHYTGGVTGPITDSLPTGTYTIRVY
ncbi:MAG: hypothetical protein EBZ77_11035, partial [Chitinophagia bacterium]|nr:hypothetical protein [Chitinophagia bacterium]